MGAVLAGAAQHQEGVSHRKTLAWEKATFQNLKYGPY